MKKFFLVLGTLQALIFLSFYGVKQLMFLWGAEKLYLDYGPTKLLTFSLLGLAFLIYVVAGIIVKKHKIRFGAVFAFAAVFNLSLLIVWNIASNDLYTHIQRGRMVAEYSASPYAVTYDSFKDDIFYKETRTVWSGQLSIYGPAFTLFNALISLVAQESLLAHILIYKLVYAVLTLGVGYLIWKMTKNVYAAFLYAWNPAVIFEIQLNGHLEMLSIFPIVAAVYLLVTRVNWRRYIWAISILTLGSLTKFFSLVLYPFYIWYAFRRLTKWRERLFFLGVGGVIQVAIVGLVFLPFLDQMGMMDGLLRLANSQFISPSLTTLILFKLFEIFGWHKFAAQSITQIVFKVGYVALFLRSLLLRRFTNEKVFVGVLLLAFAGFVLVYLNLVLPWYLLTLIVFLAIYFGLTRNIWYAVGLHLTTLYSFLLYFRVV